MKVAALTDLQLDALREVGGIGAGHAATALSQLVDRPIELQVPTIEVVKVEDVPAVFGGPEELVLAVYARMLGDLAGGILFMTDQEAAVSLVAMLHGREKGDRKTVGHEEEAMLRHVSTIVISAYLAAIARMADLDVLPSSPVLALDMAGALLQAVVVEVGMKAEQAVLVRTSFLDEGKEVQAALFFVPDPDSLSVILGRIGMA